MTDNEIIKALELCFSEDFGKCEECPLKNQKDEVFTCIKSKQIFALDLINRQNAEIERLKNLVDGMSVYFPSCIDCDGKTTVGVRTDKCVYLEDDTNYCAKRGIDNISRILKENETLKAENYELQHKISNCNWVIEGLKIENYRLKNTPLNDFIDPAKSEAIKEFAERLPELIPNFNGETTMECVDRAIKLIVKEMTERKEDK